MERLPTRAVDRIRSTAPSLEDLQRLIQRSTVRDVADALAANLRHLDAEQLRRIGPALASFGRSKGFDVPAGVERGEAAAIGAFLATVAKSDYGVHGALRLVQLAGNGRGMKGAMLAMTPLGRRGWIGLLADPQTRSLITGVIRSLGKP